MSVLICFLLTLLCLGLAISHFLERGVLLNNTWLYASGQERLTLNKKPLFRQSSVIFLLLGFLFAFLGIGICTGMTCFWLFSVITAITAILYAIISSVKIGKELFHHD